MNRCFECKAPISYSGSRCRKCYHASRKPRDKRFCLDCGKQLCVGAPSAGNTRCGKCAANTPERRAQRSAASKAIYIDNPAQRERSRQAVAILNTPEARALRRKSKAKRARTIRERRWAWCPPEYWDAYVRLRDQKVSGARRGAVAARAIIERRFGGPLVGVSMTIPQWRRHECSIDGRPVPLRPAHSEMLAVMLLADPDQCLSRDDLVERLWPDATWQPEYAFNIVKTYVSALRALGVRIIRSGHKGYRIPREARGRDRKLLAA